MRQQADHIAKEKKKKRENKEESTQCQIRQK